MRTLLVMMMVLFSPIVSAEGWTFVGETPDNGQYFIKTDHSKTWVKQVKGDTTLVALVKFDCRQKRMRTVESHVLSSDHPELARLGAQWDSHEWRNVVPDTIGESLYSAVCHQK